MGSGTGSILETDTAHVRKPIPRDKASQLVFQRILVSGEGYMLLKLGNEFSDTHLNRITCSMCKLFLGGGVCQWRSRSPIAPKIPVFCIFCHDVRNAVSIGSTPAQVIVTTRTSTCLVRNPKPNLHLPILGGR